MKPKKEIPNGAIILALQIKKFKQEGIEFNSQTQLAKLTNKTLGYINQTLKILVRNEIIDLKITKGKGHHTEFILLKDPLTLI